MSGYFCWKMLAQTLLFMPSHTNISAYAVGQETETWLQVDLPARQYNPNHISKKMFKGHKILQWPSQSPDFENQLKTCALNGRGQSISSGKRYQGYGRSLSGGMV
jgi:hypothetical protein